MQLNTQIQQADRNPSNSNHPIKSRINQQRRRVEQSNPVPIKVDISQRAPQLGSRVAGDRGILNVASEGDQRPAGGGEEQTEEPRGRGDEVSGVQAGCQQSV